MTTTSEDVASKFPQKDTFQQLLDEFTSHTTEVKNMFLSRVTGSVKKMYKHEIDILTVFSHFSSNCLTLNSAQKEVAALDVKLMSLFDFLNNEKNEIEKAKALQKACLTQKSHLDYIRYNLPAHLPRWESSPLAENQPKQRTAPIDSQPIPEPAQKKEKAQNLKTKKRVGNPRQYVSQDELDSVSSYMKGRLTIERINKAVDEMASRAESNSKLLEVARSKGGTITSEERRHAMEVLYKITKLDAVAGHWFFLESDLKGGTHATLDKTGKAILTVLRHLGKINETRVTVDDCARVVYVINS